MKLNNEISNNGLELSMEFGENWLKEINSKLLNEYSDLSEKELNNYNRLCKTVNKTGNDFIRKNPVKTNGKIEFIDIKKFEKFILEKYSWINDKNINKLYSQSCYYAMK